MTTRLGWWIASFCGAGIALASGAAAAQRAGGAGESPSPATSHDSSTSDEQARRAFRLGRELYENGRFAEAAAEFERAYALSGRSELLYDAYLAYRDAQRDEDAARTLRAYLESVPEGPDHAGLWARLEALEREIAERHAQQEAAAEAARQAEEARRRAAEAERRAAERSARPTVREIPGEVWPWAVLGVGGAMIATGVITGALAMSERSSLDSSCPLQLCPAGFGLAGRQTSIRSLAIATDVLLFGGGAATIAGLVLGILLGPRTEVTASGAPTVSANCTADGCGAIVRAEW